MPTTILIAAAQRLLREGLRRILASCTELEVVAEADEGRTAIELARETLPDVALIDAQLPRLAGCEVMRQLRSASAETRCILFSGEETPAQVRRAFQLGALAFVPKSATGAELLDAIRSVRLGRAYLPPSITDHVLACVRGGVASSDATLTERQREVLQLVTEGMSVREIATALGISEATAKTHRAALMRRLGVRKASGLVRFAIREGIVAA